MTKKHIKLILLILGCVIFLYFIRGFIITGLLFATVSSAKVEINEDILKYNNYIGANAEESYRNKWGMDETIFPKTITSSMRVLDYKMVYYNPWDAQYLSYLVVEYPEKEYRKELQRLENYPSTEYLGYY